MYRSTFAAAVIVAVAVFSSAAHGAVTACTTAPAGANTATTKGFAWGANQFGQISSRTDDKIHTPYPLLVGSAAQRVTDISGGFMHIGVFDAVGKQVWFAGRNTEGQLGGGPTAATAQSTYLPVPFVVDVSEPVLFSRDVVSAAAGFEHSCIVTAKATDTTQNIVFCAGKNDRGQLGRSDVAINVTYILAVTSTDAAYTGASIAKVIAGPQFTVALTTTGTVWAWGANDNGQLGTGDQVDTNTPKQIASLSSISDVKCGNNYCLALDAAGALWGWGLNDQSQLGSAASTTAVLTPVQVLTGVAQFSAGGKHGLAIVSNELYAWGCGTSGATAHPKNIPAAVKDKWHVAAPTAVAAFSGVNIQSAAAGAEHSIVLDTCGNVYTFGADHFGQLGRGRLSTRQENFGSLVPIKNANIAVRNVTPITVYAGWFNSIVIAV
jgi:alpha-tubulin suppressor-like RCC1 family protein